MTRTLVEHAARRDTRCVETGAVHHLPVGRHLSIDERGVALRATWRLDHGFINLSLWRRDRCVETFHLTPGEAAQLVGFLVDGLADAATAAPMAQPVLAVATQRLSVRPALIEGARRLRRDLANVLERSANRLRS